MISMEIVFQVVHLFTVLVEGLLPGMEINFILWIPIIQKAKVRDTVIKNSSGIFFDTLMLSKTINGNTIGQNLTKCINIQGVVLI